MEDGAQENCTNINSNSLQSLITQICARSKSLLILWNFLKIGVAIFFEDATHRLSDILPMAFRTYRPRPFAHTLARNICGRSKLWCWRHRCTVRGSTSGAVYTSWKLPILRAIPHPLKVRFLFRAKRRENFWPLAPKARRKFFEEPY